MRILIAEQDRDIVSYLKQRLDEKCCAVDIAYDGQTAIRLAKSNDYDIILSEYHLPERTGFCLCSEIRNYNHERRCHVPMIMITQDCEVNHIIESLNRGFDDCLRKPFFFDELFARIQAVLRRPNLAPKSTFAIDTLTFDSRTQKVARDGKIIHLTKKEFSLLEFLLKNKGCVIPRSTIVENVWDMHCDPLSNTIEMHVLNLRRKIDLPGQKPLIHNSPGRGYKIDIVR